MLHETVYLFMQLSQLLQCTPEQLLYLTLQPLGLHVMYCWSLRGMQQGEPAHRYDASLISSILAL